VPPLRIKRAQRCRALTSRQRFLDAVARSSVQLKCGALNLYIQCRRLSPYWVYFYLPAKAVRRLVRTAHGGPPDVRRPLVQSDRVDTEPGECNVAPPTQLLKSAKVSCLNRCGRSSYERWYAIKIGQSTERSEIIETARL